MDWLSERPAVLAFLGSGFVVGLMLLVIAVSRPRQAEPLPQPQAPVVITRQPAERPRGRWETITGRLQPGLDVYIRIGNRAPEYVFKILQVNTPADREMMLVEYPNGSVERKRRQSFTVDSNAYVCWVE
jgi:hypothetical protein